MKNTVRYTIKLRITAFFAALCLILTGSLASTAYAAVPTDHWKSSSSGVAATKDQIHSYFPESYWASLDALIEAHPNWTFQAFYTGLYWNECFDGTYTKYDASGDSELYPARNLLQAGLWPSSWYSTTIKGAYSWAGNSWTVHSAPNWIQASEEAIRYCMDPRNFLTTEQIFQFEDQTYYEASVAEVEAVFKRTTGGNWTKAADQTGIYSEYSKKNMTYAQAVYEIGKLIGMNPVILASRIIQEQGEGNSPLISGTKTFTVTSGPDTGMVVNGGYYNYFNMEATDGGSNANYELIYNNGLTEAYKSGWDTRYKALYGGAEKFKRNFVAKDQDTFYFQKFSVKSDSSYCMWHQYMQSLTTPQHEANKSYNGYKNSGTLEVSHRFIIPVFMNMTASPEPRPTRDGNPNYKIGSIYVNGATVYGFSADNYTYNMSVSNDKTTARLNIHTYAPTTTIEVAGYKEKSNLACNVDLMVGNNTFRIVSTAENGTKVTYTVGIYRESAAFGQVQNSTPEEDFTWDGDVIIAYNGDSENVVIPERAVGIGTEAFKDNTTLKNVDVTEGVVYIGSGAFEGCTSLKEVLLPGSLTSVKERAFMNCDALKGVRVPASVTEIGNEAFGYTEIYEYEIPDRTDAKGEEGTKEGDSGTEESEDGIGETTEGESTDTGLKVTVSKIEGFIIYSTTGTAAERYARDNGFGFIDITARNGWISDYGTWYYYRHGTLVRNEWIGNYYVGSDGKMATNCWIDGWYVGKDGAWVPGAVKNDWLLIKGDWYYFVNDKKLCSQWIDNTYYVQADGKMARDQWIGSYYVGKDGAWVPGAVKNDWLQEGGYWYYYRSGTRAVNQWVGDYYVGSDGKMAVSKWIGNYYVGADGKWVPNAVKPSSGRWILSGGKWWYRHADGSYTTNNWEKIDGKWYHFDSAGWMQTGWIQLSGTWYYLNSSGAMVTGEVSIGGRVSVFASSGAWLGYK